MVEFMRMFPISPSCSHCFDTIVIFVVSRWPVVSLFPTGNDDPHIRSPTPIDVCVHMLARVCVCVSMTRCSYSMTHSFSHFHPVAFIRLVPSTTLAYMVSLFSALAPSPPHTAILERTMRFSSYKSHSPRVSLCSYIYAGVHARECVCVYVDGGYEQPCLRPLPLGKFGSPSVQFPVAVLPFSH